MVFGLVLFAENVSKNTAEKVAKSYYFQAVNSISPNSLKYDEIKLTCIMDPSVDESKNLYIFNINEDEGFIIVSSNYLLQPILAYSFKSSYNTGNISPAQQYLIDYYQLMNKKANNNELIESKDSKIEWEELIDFTPEQKFNIKSTEDGLLGDIEWNQSMPYNGMCPEVEDAYTGYGGRCPVGCSAIAMLQIMKYYNWPFEGTGSYTHYSWDNGGFGDITVNFGANTYDWYSMPNSGQVPNDELAKTCFHAGVAIKMHWSADGSGAAPSDVLYAMENYFSYENNIDLIYKEDYSEEDWKSILRSQIDNQKPIFYVGYSDVAGHAWNCDGYQGEDHFHMNCGWGGYGNGFYTLDALGTSATPGDTEGNYSQWQHALINIYPDTDFPQYCAGTTYISGTEGSFGDGSSYENYQSNSSCTYIIEPECRQIVMLGFTKCELANGDLIQVWDGEPADNVLLGTIDIDNPPLEEYESISGKMTIEFNSDDNENADGWTVDYSTKNCVPSRTYTEASGNFDDGSKECQYTGATLCSWTIQPESASEIYIDFESFDVGGDIDFVNIYKNNIFNDNLIAEFNKNNSPSGTITVDAGTAIIRFFASANSTLGDGWELSYNSNSVEISTPLYQNNITISPNPGDLNSVVSLGTDYNGPTNITIQNVLGEVLIKKEINISNKETSFPLNSFSELKEPGMYFFTITINGNQSTQKFILID